MKIRRPSLLRLVGFVLYWLARVWLSTLRHRSRSLGLNLLPDEAGPGQKYLYAFWHENLVVPFHRYVGPKIHVLISQHADGELVAEACRYGRSKAIRGSTTRGGIEAARQLLRASRKHHLAVVPDGPRGPRRHIKPGLIYLAACTGVPIVVVGFGCRRPWRLHTWDRFVLPRPWSESTAVLDGPIHVPADLGKAQLEHYRRLVEARLHRVTELAEEWAESGKWPAAAKVPVVMYDDVKRSA
jgi:lysophospholipid acyltransferase (LPLAT)-like uncharacterized protein